MKLNITHQMDGVVAARTREVFPQSQTHTWPHNS